MLDGFTPWPPELAQRFRAGGYWEGLTLWGMVARTVARLPDKVALVAGERRETYADLDRASARLGAALLRQGIRPLDRVVVQLPNTPEFVHWYLALVRIGAIPVLALRAHRHTEVRHFIRASGAVAYVVPDVAHHFDYRPMATQMQGEFAGLRVYVVGEAGDGQTAHAALLQGLTDDEGTAEIRAAEAAVDPADVATMLLSGGTTSLSKLIPRTHEDYVLNARLCGRAGGFDEQTVFMAILPLGHNYNLASPGILGAFYTGGTVVLAPGTDTAEIFRLVEQERVTVIAAVVPLISAWLASDEPKRFDHSSLKVVQNGGARLAPELRQRLISELACTPQEIYGTAEGLINMTRLDDPLELILHSSGRPVCEDDEIAVVDDDGREVPDGEAGELITRGPYTIRGYYRAPEKNSEAFTADGFYRMGDIVRKWGRNIQAEGRRKDLINRGGEKISCEEVENFIHRHPAVKSACLVAMPDPVFGEKACAFVVLREGESLTFEGLTTFLRGLQIASYKLPERLEVVTQFPLSPVGKILKRELRDAIAARLDTEAKV
ncbi:MAG: AMP-binding protein [Comamonadaceae bacterium]|uniref:(2,3-dihydroxybenzoyl)adenylate synthase n=1 Tax=Candidatus Skiveiella danica TaxID=3386177 RepID=UPI00390BC4BA|nr:AMP-binding protein [Comamonadaceae bacterium]